MIPQNVTSALFIGGGLMTVFPIILLIVLAVRRKISGLPLLFGALAWFISQAVIRIPILSVIQQKPWYAEFAENNLWLLIVILSFTAGLFEESARLGGAALLKKHRTYKDIISFGLGHGLCEAVILVGLSFISNGITAMAAPQLAQIDMPEIQTALEQLAALNPSDIYLGVWERVPAVMFHVCATYLVFKGVNEHKARYYFLAMLFHTLFNVIGVGTVQLAGAYAGEVVITVMGFAMAIYVFAQRPKKANQEEITA